MKKTFIRLLSMVLCLITLVALFAACDDKGGRGGLQVTTTTTTTTTPDPDEDLPEVKGELGIIPESVDFGEEVYQLLLWDNAKYQLFPESTVEGESIQNDLYFRTKMIEEKMNLHLDLVFKAASGADSTLLNHALEGNIPYVGICSYSTNPPKLAKEGVLADLNSLEYPDTRMDWYPKQIEAWEYKDRLFFLSNNSSVRNILANWVIFANNTMIADKGLEEIADVVLDGRWTLDVLRTYARNWDAEAQGNANKVEADRVYGFTIVQCGAIQAFYYAAGFKVTVKDAEGAPEYIVFNASEIEKTSAFVDTFLDICTDPNYGYSEETGMYSPNWDQPLRNENTAFFAGGMDGYTLIDEDGTWTIIPMPKLNEEQEEYYTIQNYAFDVWCVPKEGKDVEVGGMIIEASSYNDYAEIAMKFYEYDFKYRYSNDARGVQIFDLIRTSFYADFARGWVTKGPEEPLKQCLTKGPGRVMLTNSYATDIGNLRTDCRNDLRALDKLIKANYPD